LKNIYNMPKSKNAEHRFLMLDRCFSDFKRFYTIEDLLDKVNAQLYEVSGAIVKERQLRADMADIRKMLPDGIYLDAIPFDGKRCYYRYSEEYSIYKNELSVSELQNLRSTIEMLSRYRGLPCNSWLEEVISNLEVRFGVKTNAEKFVSFGENEQLDGLQYLSRIIDATINKQVLEIEYLTYDDVYHNHILHPYFVKQYNNRWFLFGLDDTENRLKTLAFDRIKKFKKSVKAFRKNEVIDFSSYFDNVVGVTVPNNLNAQLETIELKFASRRFRYVISKPIHKSQQVKDVEKCIISLKLYPNRELEQQIFSFGPDVEVLAPEWFRIQMIEKISENLKKYFPMQNLCIANNELCIVK